MSTETPKAIVPFTEEWFAYIISTRTEEGSIRCLSMMTQAELQRLRGLLDEAENELRSGLLDFDGIVSVIVEKDFPDKAFIHINGTKAATSIPTEAIVMLREAFDIMQLGIRKHFLSKLKK